ncbi:DUF7344 domain-containing protein [Haladaptatus sp. DFWS20]|uniref:DUF7344 domain-containing protein n=1 Tax=Haladaptatus sp. DFWS20 TaxID=3403467 RepID=UPI003EB87248
MSERQANVDTREQPPSEQSVLSAELLFDVLGSSYRRFVLSNLSSEPKPVPIDELAYRLAAWEDGTTDADVTSETADDVEILLYHVHLPKMAELGLVAYDSETGIIVPGEKIEAATNGLELAEF